jgi:hypothetical protein
LDELEDELDDDELDEDDDEELDELDDDELMLPVQIVPFSLNCVGAGLDPFQAPLKPGVTVAPVPRLAAHEGLRTVTRAPDWEKLPFHPC